MCISGLFGLLKVISLTLLMHVNNIKPIGNTLINFKKGTYFCQAHFFLSSLHHSVKCQVYFWTISAIKGSNFICYHIKYLKNA